MAALTRAELTAISHAVQQGQNNDGKLSDGKETGDTKFSYYPASDFVDLSDPKVLTKYVDPSLKEYSPLCLQVARKVYESGIRSIKNTAYGVAFPVEPEILARAMRLAKNEVAVEIAGASGENSVLLAFAGAKKVYMNDIEPGEMGSFRELRAQLPDAVKSRLVPVEGDCFDLLKKKPKLANQVGLVLCRNFIHFLTNEKQTEFFQNVKGMLKPGGQAIFTANSSYALGSEHREVFEANPEATCFANVQCLITDYSQGTMPCAIPYRQITPCEDQLLAVPYTSSYLYEKSSKTGNKWKVDNAAFNKIDAAIRPKIKKAVQDNQEMIKRISSGSVRVLKSAQRLYNIDTLPALFKQNGFEVEQTFVTGRNGHLVPETDILSKGQQMGVIVKYQPEHIADSSSPAEAT